jgi:opacity protein-like surface antigen
MSSAAGVLGVFHQQFKPWLGYNVNLGYTRSTVNYSYESSFTPTSSALPTSTSLQHGSIGTNVYEVSVASVIQGPHTKRFSTFTQVGGGGLFFLPTQRPASTSQQTRPALVFGAGMNYKLTDHLAVRAEYRGLFYKSPDFVPEGSPTVPRLFTVTSEPTVSVVYTFGGTKKTKRPKGMQ